MARGVTTTGGGSEGRRGPQQGTGAAACWGSRGRSPREQNAFGVFTLAETAFPESN